MLKVLFNVKRKPISKQETEKALRSFEISMIATCATSIVFIAGIMYSTLNTDRLISQYEKESIASKKLVTKLLETTDKKTKESLDITGRFNTALDYKKELIYRESGIRISKNLPEKHLDMMMATADYWKIPYKIYFRLGARESDYFSSIKSSPKGAMYYFQIMPGTFKGYAKHILVKKHTVESNIRVSGFILADLYKTYGNWTKAVAAYNAGTNAVNKYNGVPNYKETITYVNFIMRRF